jgi:hypothetical protein
MTPDELLERLAGELRGTIGPAVEEPFSRTQAFMGAVILERLARQLRSAEVHAAADRADLAALIAELGPRAAGAAGLAEIVAALWADRDELGEERFDELLTVVRRVMRARLDRELEYSA